MQASSIEHQDLYGRLIEFCLLFLIIFTPLAYGAVEPWGIATIEITAAIMGFLWVFKMLKNGVLEFVHNPINIFIFFFIFYVFLQLWTVDRGPWTIYFWATKTELFKIISYTLIFFVTLNTIKTKRQMIRILSVIIAAGFMMSVFYLIRYFGLKVPRGFINPDHFSAYLGMIIPLAFGLLFVQSLTAERYARYAYGYLLTFVIIIMSTALFFTMSRGGIFSFMITLLVMGFLAATRRSIKNKGLIFSAIIIVMILAVIWLGATPVVEKMLSVKAEVTSLYFGGRLPIWQGTYEIVKRYPLFGTGLGTFSYIFPEYQPVKIINRHYAHAHSDIFELLAETGILFFVLTSIFVFWFLAKLGKGFARRHNLWVVGLTIGFFGSIMSILIHSFTDFNLHIPANALLLAIILALFLLVLDYRREDTCSLSTRRYSVGKIKFIFYPTLVILGGAFFVAVIRPGLADYCFHKAEILFEKENPDIPRAMPYVQRAIRLDSANAEYHYQLGKLYAQQLISPPMPTGRQEFPVPSKEQLNKAISEYQKAIELNPTNSKYHQSFAWTYSQFADLPNLSACYSPASMAGEARHCRISMQAWRLLATNNAKRHFQQAISLEPNNPYRHRAYAIWLFNHSAKENIEKGAAEYRKATELEPKFKEEVLVKYSTVEKSYKKLKAILPDTPENHYKVMNKILEADLWEQNESDFGKDMEKATYKYPYYKAISEYYSKKKEIDKSIQVLKDYLKIDPNCAEAHFYLADRLIYKKPVDWELFFKEIEKALELEPENEWYRYWYAVYLFRNKKYQEADKQFKKVIELNLAYSKRIEIFKSSGGKKAE